MRPVPASLLSNHGRVLVAIARHDGATLREIADIAGIIERTAHRLVTDLEVAGYLTRRREGARNRYTINPDAPIDDPLLADHWVGEILAVLAGTHAWSDTPRRRPDGNPERRRAERRRTDA